MEDLASPTNQTQTNTDSKYLDRFNQAFQEELRFFTSLPTVAGHYGGVTYVMQWDIEDVYVLKNVDILEIDENVGKWISREDAVDAIIENLHNDELREYQKMYDKSGVRLRNLAALVYLDDPDFAKHYDTRQFNRVRMNSIEPGDYFEYITMELIHYAGLQS